MYPNFKLHIFKLGIHQNQMAKDLGFSDALISKIIHGYREPTPDEKRQIAAYLRVDEAWLFEKCELPSRMGRTE